MKIPIFKIEDVDQGFCRVLYSTKNDQNQKIYYCIQEEFKNSCVLYRCSQGPYFEPMSPSKIKAEATIIMEVPSGDTQLEQAVRQYIKEHKQIQAVSETIKVEVVDEKA